MFGSTLIMHFDGSDRNLVRINQDKFASTYRYRALKLNIDLNIRHSTRVDSKSGLSIDRHNVELVITSYTLDTTGKTPEVRKAYLTFENPAAMSFESMIDALKYIGNFTENSNHVVEQMVNWES